MFFNAKKQQERNLNFSLDLLIITDNINNGTSHKAHNSKFVTRKWNIANVQSNANYSLGNKIISSTEVSKSNLCDCNDAYILITCAIFVRDNGT